MEFETLHKFTPMKESEIQRGVGETDSMFQLSFENMIKPEKCKLKHANQKLKKQTK